MLFRVLVIPPKAGIPNSYFNTLLQIYVEVEPAVLFPHHCSHKQTIILQIIYKKE